MDAKIIYVEGVDRSGKGSLIEAIHKATNYKHVILDRGIISNYVYMTVYNRYSLELERRYKKLENQIAQTDHLVIHVTCSLDELERRADETQHEEVDFEYHSALFQLFISTSNLNTITVDTTDISPEDLAANLLERGII